MAKSRTFETGINLSIWDGGEHEFVLKVEYDFTPAFAGSRDEPGHDAGAFIFSARLFHPKGTEEFVVPDWMLKLVLRDDALIASLVADAQEAAANARADAAERKAEAAHDDAMMEAR